jgi:hypothetical protein
MPSKRGAPEDVYDAALQDPRDMVKVTQPETQFPAMQ